MNVRVALAQMPVLPGEVERNLATACSEIARGREHGADIVLLPEALDLGWTYPRSRGLAQPIPDGLACRLLAAAAAASGVYVCAGLTETAGGRTYNAAVLIGPDGALLLVHRKIHEIPFANAHYDTGDRLSVVETRFGRIGVLICADALAPDTPIATTLGLMGARLLLSPCAWADEAGRDLAADPYGGLWRDAYGPVSRRFALPIAAVSNVGPVPEGPWQARRCIGNSLVFDAKGDEVATGPYGVDAAALLVVDLDLPDGPR